MKAINHSLLRSDFEGVQICEEAAETDLGVNWWLIPSPIPRSSNLTHIHCRSVEAKRKPGLRQRFSGHNSTWNICTIYGILIAMSYDIFSRIETRLKQKFIWIDYESTF